MGRARRAMEVLALAAYLLSGALSVSATAEVRVADGLQLEVVVTGVQRPVQLAFDASGDLVVLSHGWRGNAAAEIHRLARSELPLDVSRTPGLVIAFSDSPRNAVFGSLAVDPKSGDLFLGEENGNRVYRRRADGNVQVYAVGLHHLVGGSSLAFDGAGRLVILDYASQAGRLSSEGRLPPALDWLTSEGYQGPLVFRLDPRAGIPLPRRLDLVAPLFPTGQAWSAEREVLPRLVSVAASPAGDLFLLGSQGEVFGLGMDRRLQLVARLPAGHYHRTNMTVGADGAVFVNSGFHVRRLFRICPAGTVSTVASELGDPGGVAVDRAGALYVAETALHRILRVSPSAGAAASPLSCSAAWRDGDANRR